MVKDKTTNKPKKTPEMGEKKTGKPLNDGMNTPVPDHTSTNIPSASEAALLKQAENPLGDPNRV